jgi:hypothetical protein
VPEQAVVGAVRHTQLVCHADSPAGPMSGIEVEVSRAARVLTLRYSARGDMASVRIPRVSPPARCDGLWKHTCFEAFLCQETSEAYWEFNFSPSLRWAAYRFDRYREGMIIEHGIADLRIGVESNNTTLGVSAVLNLSSISAMPNSDTWRLGLSAIIEDGSGAKSYWALTHPAGKPDFHHTESFLLCLAP